MSQLNTSIIVRSYFAESQTERSEKELFEFFSYCGYIEKYALIKELDGSNTFYITFDTIESKEVALLLHDTELGLEGKRISVENFPETDMQNAELIWTTVFEKPKRMKRISAKTQAFYTKVINSLLQAGYKLRENIMETARQYDSKLREVLHTTAEATSNTIHNIQDKTEEAVKQAGDKMREAGEAVGQAFTHKRQEVEVYELTSEEWNETAQVPAVSGTKDEFTQKRQEVDELASEEWNETAQVPAVSGTNDETTKEVYNEVSEKVQTSDTVSLKGPEVGQKWNDKMQEISQALSNTAKTTIE